MKMIFNFWFFNFIILPFFSYSTTNSENNVLLKLDKNDTIIKKIIVEEIENEFYDNIIFSKSKLINQDLVISFNLNESKFFRFNCLIPQISPILVYISPGDTIVFKIQKDNSILFEGNNSSHYNFYSRLNNYSEKYPKYTDKDGELKFKEKTNSVYINKILFLENYSIREKTSYSFIKKTKEVLKFEYINWLLNRSILPNKNNSNYIKYLNEINSKSFGSVLQNDNPYFNLALINYLFFVSKNKTKSELYSLESLNYQIKYIDENFEGEIREFAIVKTFDVFQDNIKHNNITILTNCIKTNLLSIKSDIYIKKLKKIYENLISTLVIIPDNILNSELSDINGKNISFRDILITYGKSIKIIDFWASWCAPCIEDIENTSLFRSKLNNDKKIEFIYLSIDKNKENWIKKVQYFKKIGISNNHFLIPENSELIIFFNLNSIPKYISLDKENNIYQINSPHPADSDAFNNLIKEILK